MHLRSGTTARPRASATVQSTQRGPSQHDHWNGRGLREAGARTIGQESANSGALADFGGPKSTLGNLRIRQRRIQNLNKDGCHTPVNHSTILFLSSQCILPEYQCCV